jgi:hypothetical protein
MLKKTLLLAVTGALVAGQAQAITLDFDWDGGAFAYDVPLGGGAANGTDYSGTTLMYNYGPGILTVGSSTNDTVQDIRPPNAGIGADGGVNGDNTGPSEWLTLAFSTDVTVTSVSFNGGAGGNGGHGDDWTGDSHEIYFTLENGGGVVDDKLHNFAGSSDGVLDGLTGQILSTDFIKMASVDTRFYLESITFELDEIEITTFSIPVPEPETLLLFSLGLIGLGATLRHRRKETYS